jgi:hypothetical protein
VIKGKTVAETEKLWHAVAKKGDPADLDELLATPWPGRPSDALPRVTALAARPRDPRIVSAFIDLLRAMPWTKYAATNVWFHVIQLLGDSADPRAFATIRDLIDRGTTFSSPETIRMYLVKATERLRAANVLPAAISSAAPALPAGEARLVEADALVERGDPRGELIALQTARAEARGTRSGLARERALLREHERAWLGALAGLVTKGSTVWERGVLVECQLAALPNAEARAAGEPALATVRRLRFRRGIVRHQREVASLLTHPVCAALRELDGLDPELVIGSLNHGKLPPLESVFGTRWFDRHVEEAHRLLPALRRIGAKFGWGTPPDALTGAPIWQRVEEAGCWPDERSLLAWITALHEKPSSSIQRIRLVTSETGGSVVYDRASGCAEVTVDRYFFEAGLRGAPVTRLRVRALRGKLDEKKLARFAKELGAELELLT